MKSVKDTKQSIRKLKVESSDEIHNRVLDKLLRVLDKSKKQTAVKQPFVLRIIMKSRITKLAAVILIASGLFLYTFVDGDSAWAAVIKAFNEVTNVHISGLYKGPNGTLEYEWYIKRPDCLYEESVDKIVIDNGKERLTLDNKEKTAQFSDSFMPYNPLKEHHMLVYVGLFRSEKTEGYEFKKLVDESNETMIVYSLRYEEFIKVRAWVDANTMLPLKIEVKRIDPNASFEYQIVFEYQPIPDDVFTMVIPEGFTELPRQQRGVISGKVIDENGQAVDNAVVYAVDKWGHFAEKSRTDTQGRFSFELPPEGAHKHVYMPLFLRAFIEGDPNTVAWTTINNPAIDRNIGAEIPGELGEIEFEGIMLKNATGIVIEMESAGNIFGTITDLDGNALPNATVKLICDPLVKWRTSQRHLGISNLGGSDKIAQSDEHGYYEFSHLPRFGHNSSFTLIAKYPGYVDTRTRFRCKEPLETKQVDIKLFEAGLTVTGTLIDNYGQPLSARYISIAVTADKCSSSVGTKTDEDGVFKTEGAPISRKFKITADLSHKHVAPHDKEKWANYVYYPDVSVDVDLYEVEDEDGQCQIEVELVAQKPELILNVEVKSTDGELLKYFPVEVRGDPGTITTQWKLDKKFKQRTNEYGRCIFTEVPDVNGLKLVLWGRNDILNEKLSDEEEKIAEEYREKYFWSEVPINVIEDKKEYHITAVALTHEEYNSIN